VRGIDEHREKVFENAARIAQDVVIPIAQHMKAAQGEVRITSCILFRAMLPAIGLHDDLSFKTDEVHNPRAKRHLAAKLYVRKPPRRQKTPQHTLRVGGIPS
jgi:hypothetical protein